MTLQEVKEMLDKVHTRATGNPKGNIKSWTARQLKTKYTCRVNKCGYLAQNLTDLRTHKDENHAY